MTAERRQADACWRLTGRRDCALASWRAEGVCFRQQNGEGCCTYRLLRSERVGGKVRQLTLLNLGRRFPIRPQHGPLLCSRVGQLLHPQEALCPSSARSPSSERRSATSGRWWRVRPRCSRRRRAAPRQAASNGLQKHSALGELLEVDFCALSHRSLYRASEVLMKHREAIEARLLGAHQN